MILYRWQGTERNFGDELNALLWPRLLPDFFDDDPTTRFLGVGSILDRRHVGADIKVVAGSGYGGYERAPRLDDSWLIHWVRGPHTARMLGIPTSLGVGDPAALIPLAIEMPTVQVADIGFMPHFESATHGAWQTATADAGIRLIDPRNDPSTIVAAIRGCRVLLSEALHGVIVADALRVPWIAIQPLVRIHRPKWQDWAETLGIRIAFHALGPSSLLEWARSSPCADYHTGRRLISRHASRLEKLGAERFRAHASAALARAARAPPQLSAASALDRSQDRMMDRLTALRQNALAPRRPLTEQRDLLRTGVRTCFPASIPRTTLA